MGLRDRLKTRAVERADVRGAVPATADGQPTLFELAYGVPDQARLKQASTFTYLEGAEAEAALAKPLTDAQREGIRAQAQAAGLEPHPGDAVSAAADDALVRAERLLREQRGE